MNILNIIKYLAVGGTSHVGEAENRNIHHTHDAIDAQNREFELLSECGITNGKPGSWSDRYVLEKIREIESSAASGDWKYKALDNLSFGVCNNHAHGNAAKVLRDVDAAISRQLGY